MSSKELYSSWVEIDLSAIHSNAHAFSKLTKVEVIAVVKANAYGHGAVESARAALAGGSARLAVARVEEALELRQAGIQAPILILGWTPPGRLEEMTRLEKILDEKRIDTLARELDTLASKVENGDWVIIDREIPLDKLWVVLVYAVLAFMIVVNFRKLWRFWLAYRD